MKYVILTLLLTGCGLPRHYDSNPDFDAYTARFEQETGVKVTVPIVYSSLDKETVALCEEFSDGYRLIRVNSFYWEEMKNGGKEETIYHELGHCQLNRDHSDELTTTRLYVYAIPNSIMYPYIFGDVSFYWIFRDHYVQELMFPGKRLEFQLKEGDVVIVVGKLDDHIRDKEDRVGTVVYLNKEEAVVLLSNGDLWKGHKRDVVLQSEQLSY